jgi:hypothetical protein
MGRRLVSGDGSAFGRVRKSRAGRAFGMAKNGRVSDQTRVPEPRTIRILEDRWTTLRHVVEAIAIVAAGAWAFYTFIYQEDIKPANEPASLDVSVSIARLGRDARRDILQATLHVRNSGKTEIDVAADALNVWGDRFADRQRSRQTNTGYGRRDDFKEPRISRRLLDSFAELRSAAVGGNVGNHIVLEPGVSYDFGDVVVLPRGAYELIHAEGIAVPVKTSLRRKIRVRISRGDDRGFWLDTDDASESDYETDFALIP